MSFLGWLATILASLILGLSLLVTAASHLTGCDKKIGLLEALGLVLKAPFRLLSRR